MSWIRSIWWSFTEEARNSLNQQTIFIYTLALSLPSGQQNHFLCQLKCSTRDDWSVFRPGCGRLSGDITWPETSDAMTAIRKKLSSSSLSLRRESCCWLGRQTRLKIDYMVVVVGSGNIKFFPSPSPWMDSGRIPLFYHKHRCFIGVKWIRSPGSDSERLYHLVWALLI